MRDLNCIFCIFIWISSRNSVSSRGGIRRGSGRKLLSPRSRLVLKEKKKNNDCQTACCRFALARSVDYYDFYWLKKIVVNQDRTCVLSWQRPFKFTKNDVLTLVWYVNTSIKQLYLVFFTWSNAPLHQSCFLSEESLRNWYWRYRGYGHYKGVWTLHFGIGVYFFAIIKNSHKYKARAARFRVGGGGGQEKILILTPFKFNQRKP